MKEEEGDEEGRKTEDERTLMEGRKRGKRSEDSDP